MTRGSGRGTSRRDSLEGGDKLSRDVQELRADAPVPGSAVPSSGLPNLVWDIG